LARGSAGRIWRRQTAYVVNSTTILVTTAARAAGTVEIIVSNPDGQVGMLSGAYRYASPQSFDFNGGTWTCSSPSRGTF